MTKSPSDPIAAADEPVVPQGAEAEADAEGAPEVAAKVEDAGLVEAVLVPPSGLVPTLLLLMLAVAIWAILMPAQLHPLARPDLQLRSWQEGADALQGERKRALAASSPADEEPSIARGIAVWLAREATQGAAAIAADEAARRELAALEERLRAFGLRHGRAAVAAAATRRGISVREAFEADLKSGGHRHLASVAPGIGRTLARTGIAAWRGSDGRLVPAAALVVEGLAAQRYFGFARRMLPPRPELGSALSILLLRFRVEAHAGLDLRRRLVLAEELTALDAAWPSTWATAVLLARSGRYRAARSWFQRAAAQGERADSARHNARWCGQRLRFSAQRSRRPRSPRHSQP